VLPAAMRDAVGGLRYLEVLRMFAQMRRQYWRAEGVMGPAYTDLPIGQIQQHPLTERGSPDDRAILEAHLRGEQVAPIAALSESERLESLLVGLEKVHPGARDDYEGGATQDWASDLQPSRGAEGLCLQLVRREDLLSLTLGLTPR